MVERIPLRMPNHMEKWGDYGLHQPKNPVVYACIRLPRRGQGNCYAILSQYNFLTSRDLPRPASPPHQSHLHKCWGHTAWSPPTRNWVASQNATPFPTPSISWACPRQCESLGFPLLLLLQACHEALAGRVRRVF